MIEDRRYCYPLGSPTAMNRGWGPSSVLYPLAYLLILLSRPIRIRLGGFIGHFFGRRCRGLVGSLLALLQQRLLRGGGAGEQTRQVAHTTHRLRLRGLLEELLLLGFGLG